MSTRKLVTRYDFSQMCGVTAAAVTKACKGSLAPACYGKRIDIVHPAALKYLGREDAPKTKEKKPAIKKESGKTGPAIDWAVVDGLCRMQCTVDEVCSVLNVDLDWIGAECERVHSKSFEDYYKIKVLVGRASLRKKQYMVAVEGDDIKASMQIASKYLDADKKNDGGITFMELQKEVIAAYRAGIEDALEAIQTIKGRGVIVPVDHKALDAG
jgi:hypothetical protein